MTIELNMLGPTCDAACGYCYINPVRDAGNAARKPYDMEKMKAGLAAEGGHFTLHGGDAFQAETKDLEEIWRWGFERYGQNAVQTHGATLTDEHIALAKQYKVHVGVSVDGPGEMNDLRWFGTLEKTRRATERTHAAIEKLVAAGVPCSVIVVLHKLNTDPARRVAFKLWIRMLDQLGVSSVRFHPMEVDNEEIAEKYLPSMDEYIEFYRDMHRYMSVSTRLRIDMMADFRALLTGRDNYVTCVWMGCDPLTTGAVHGVDGQGVRTNCGRVNKDGVAHPKADVKGYERYIALFHTPQEYGGCHGCRFFFACKGGCVGEGIDGDWRNRSSFCELFKALFATTEEELDAEGVFPLSWRTKKVERIEKAMLNQWAAGRNVSIASILSGSTSGVVHGDSPHGDSPHGDSHGDHTDR